jgi:hypothetical protein
MAAAAGFPQPILHGLCTLGVSVRSILAAFAADSSNDAVLSIKVTLSPPPDRLLRQSLLQAMMAARCATPSQHRLLISGLEPLLPRQMGCMEPQIVCSRCLRALSAGVMRSVHD